MTEQEKIYFEALKNDRIDSDRVLQKKSMRGVKNSVVEKYSDQAHFIYELLQNADDAGATEAKFELYGNRLVFKHNGSRHFSVSNPDTEEADTENGVLGDINAITSIANSNKTSAEIGKFGVGFKSVFQYTTTPKIYDPNFRFYIDRFIVPVQIEDDYEKRLPNETVFIFPFNHPQKTAEIAYCDIEKKLKTLKYPILFLSNLKYVSLEFSDTLGLYGKNIDENKSFKENGITAELIKLTHNIGDDLIDQNLWLFSREYLISEKHSAKYSVGYFIGDDGKLKPVNEQAFCFFPTKELTNLNFIVHAPFLLTDSREGIKAGEQHNKDMIKLLADLAADSLLLLKKIGIDSNNRLIDDNIFNILPYDEDEFNDEDDNDKISFKPFYTAIKNKFKTEELLPTIDGYTSTENAYWASVTRLTEVFGNNQLAELSHNPEAKWVFTSLGRENTQRKNENSPVSSFIDNITKMWLDESALLKGRYTGNYLYGGLKRIFDGLDKSFIESQPKDWLYEFYAWVSERTSRINIVKNMPIFLDEAGNAVAVFDGNGQEILFLPTTGIDGYKTVNQELLKNEATVTLLKQIGIKEPTLKDEIYNLILPLYKSSGATDHDTHFLKFFNYYQECPNNQLQSFIAMIKDLPFICGKSNDGKYEVGIAQNFYIPTQDLIRYFSAKPTTKFIDFDKYLTMVGKENKEKLINFFAALCAKTLPQIYEISKSWYEVPHYNWAHSTNHEDNSWTEKSIDGLEEIITEIKTHKEIEKSISLWNILIAILEHKNTTNLYGLLCGRHRYYYYTWKQETYSTKPIKLLRETEWLFDNTGNTFNAKTIYCSTLSEQYEQNSISAKALIQFLNILEKPIVVEQSNQEDYITDEERRLQKLKSAGFTDEEIDKLIEKKLKKDNTPDDNDDEDDGEDKMTTPAVEKVIKKIRKKIKKPNTSDLSDDDDNDEDEYTKPTIDYNKKIEQAEEKSRIEIERIAHLQELQTTAANAEKYSYLWFKTLLEMEALADGEDNGNSREISISFAKAELEAGTTRTLILKHPNRYIPQFMEDLADIPLTLHYGNQTKKVAIEVMNVQSYTVRAKLKSGTEIEDIDLSLVNEAKIDAQNPTFLLDELIKGFNSLGYADDYNLKSNLTDKIDFIFGPPGTGKTTHLADKVILPLMQEDNNLKVLVLTPTNKAADVITKRIMECDKSKSYSEWLIRFGTSNDDLIEHSGIYKDKTFDIRALPKNVTVTTIARFPYDFFMPNGERLHLNALKWDYIIIDEASMIPIANIIFPLYKKTPTKFIIAGDPFQIQPITRSEAWKDENIYTMVELNNFTNPTTVPHDYKIELLTTQYRSVPTIGNVYSTFAYGGVLQHNRAESSKRGLNIDEFINVSSLNLIKFPISKYESIYKPKRLQGKTPYQIYSALFTFEYVKFIAEKLVIKNKGETFSIGIIAPYRAQADLIDKLFASYKCPQGIDIQVGTIHGFQGDECDIVFAVFNPPPKISASKEMFLNKKNIINVSVSRARDYLFIVMPDDNTENIENLSLINKVESICIDNGSLEYLSPDIEELIFNDSQYLENNSFATSHQIVNVYRKPELKYEIRSEDTAVDIQIHTDEES